MWRRTETRVFQGQPSTATSVSSKATVGKRSKIAASQARNCSRPVNDAPSGVSPTKVKRMSSAANA